MKIADLHELTLGELASNVDTLEKDMFKLKFQHGIRQIENTARLHLLKKDIARVKTIISFKKKQG